jgi:hypothetical protein
MQLCISFLQDTVTALNFCILLTTLPNALLNAAKGREEMVAMFERKYKK